MPRLNGGLTLTPFQYDLMKRWAAGDFTADWVGPPAVVQFNQLAPAQQAEALDMAGLVTTVGGGFSPGIEGGEIMRFPSTYERPFRVNHDLAPGSLTASLAIPWQGDFTLCIEDWWPAGRPNRATQDGSAFYPWMPKEWVPKDTLANWWKLGFITKKQIANKDAYVETERIL